MAWDDDLSKGAKTRIAKAGYKSKDDVLNAYLNGTFLENRFLGKKTYYEVEQCLRFEIWFQKVAPAIAPAIQRIKKEIDDFEEIVQSSRFLIK